MKDKSVSILSQFPEHGKAAKAFAARLLELCSSVGMQTGIDEHNASAA